MPEYFGPNSLAELSRLINEDISSIEVPKEDGNKPSEEGSFNYKFGHGLTVSEEKVVSVDTTDDFDGDKTLPITAAGVETIVGGIEILLKAI